MPSLGPAFSFLEAEGRSLFGPIGSMLYVGHRGDTSPWWRTTFRDVRACGVLGEFDLVFWDEGPEHVPREDALRVCSDVMARGGRLLLSCPWGLQPQGSGPDDPEFHHWGPEAGDFESIGMSARCFGTRFDGLGHGHGNIIAWS